MLWVWLSVNGVEQDIHPENNKNCRSRRPVYLETTYQIITFKINRRYNVMYKSNCENHHPDLGLYSYGYKLLAIRVASLVYI